MLALAAAANVAAGVRVRGGPCGGGFDSRRWRRSVSMMRAVARAKARDMCLPTDAQARHDGACNRLRCVPRL